MAYKFDTLYLILAYNVFITSRERKILMKEYNVITLCGSTKFKDEFIETQKQLTLQGNIVITVGFFGDIGDNRVLDDCVKDMLDDMHKRKIDMANAIFVINKNGYIGSSTRSEIEYALEQGKKVLYLEHNK